MSHDSLNQLINLVAHLHHALWPVRHTSYKYTLALRILMMTVYKYNIIRSQTFACAPVCDFEHVLAVMDN